MALPRKTRRIRKVKKKDGYGTCATPVAHLRADRTPYVIPFSETPAPPRD